MSTPDRKNLILQAIIKHFVETAEPVGSNTLIVNYKFEVSPATIRNDMANLEKEGLIFQPHTSAGRIPTDLGYRHYIESINDFDKARKTVLKTLQAIQEAETMAKAKEKIHGAVSMLSKASDCVSFATLPEGGRGFYLGISNFIRQPEFLDNAMNLSQVIEVLENDDNFINTLQTLDIDESVKVFIGRENIIEQIQSCTIMVTNYQIDGFEGFIGILGPTRMAYAYNICLLEEIKKMFIDEKQ
jgi:transcriptional regulator of heat shock response